MPGGALLEPLRSKDFRCLWLGQLVSVVGDKVDQIALGFLVYQKTGSGLQMGITLAISMLPAAVLGMVAGTYVDRFDKRRTMLAADVLRAALVLCVPFVAERFESIVPVYGIALMLATVGLFFEPAKLSLIPRLVDEDRLMAANSLDNATVSAAELVGLAFAAGLVASMGVRLAFFFDAITFIVSALFIYAIRYRETGRREQTGAVTGFGAELVEGVRYVWRHAVLRDLLSVYAVAMFAIAASVTFVYVLALETFEGGAPGLALMDGAITVGLLLGSVAVGHGGTADASRRLLWGLTGFAVLHLFLAAAPSIAWSVPVLLAMGIANMFFYVPMTTVLQTAPAPSMRGRAFAAKQTLSRAFSVGGFVAAGALAEHVGVRESIVAASVLLLLVAAVGWSRPALRADLSADVAEVLE